MSRRDCDMRVALMLLCVSSAALAEEPTLGLDMPAASAGVRAEDERNYLLRRQQEIFRLNVETDYALALQKLCQTGYGDPRLCSQTATKSYLPSANSPTEVSATDRKENKATTSQGKIGGQTDPSVQEILGVGNNLSALLVYPDGRVFSVHGPAQGDSGSVLPDGGQVIAVEARRVTMRNPAKGVISLPLDAGGASVRGDASASADP